MDFVKSAIVMIEFDLNKSRHHLNNPQIIEAPFKCEIIIIDDKGKEYKCKHEGWWYSETK